MSTIAAGTTSTTALVSTGDTTGKLTFQTNGTTTAMTIDTSQNVGIGTSSPGKRLSVETTSTGNQTLLTLNVPNTAGNNSAIEFSVNNAGSIIPVSKIATAYDGSNNIGLAFSTFNSGGLGERVRIDKDGNVGIGTSSPIAISNQTSCTVNGTNVGRFDVRVGGTHVAQYLATSTDVQIGSIANIPVLFYANGSERMRISAAGEVVIGGTSTIRNGVLSVYGSVVGVRNPSAAAGKTWTSPYIDNNNSYYIINQDNVGVYITDGGTSWTANSDERIKDIIEPIANAAEKVCSLRAVIGKYKKDEDGVRRSFLIAQDVQKVLPEAVNAQNDEIGTLGLAYTDTIPLLVAAIQELKAEVDALKAQLAKV